MTIRAETSIWVAAHKTVWAGLTLRYTLLAAGLLSQPRNYNNKNKEEMKEIKHTFHESEGILSTLKGTLCIDLVMNLGLTFVYM